MKKVLKHIRVRAIPYNYKEPAKIEQKYTYIQGFLVVSFKWANKLSGPKFLLQLAIPQIKSNNDFS